jgi:MerR family transcriptional regulator/heat shock protein HspR
LLTPTRSQGNTRLYDDETCERLETIITLTRDLGVNLAGVEIILNLREQVGKLQRDVEVLTQMVRQAVQEQKATPRFHALVRFEGASIQPVEEE